MRTLKKFTRLPEKLVHRTGRVIPGQLAGMLGSRNDPFLVELSKFNATSYGAYPSHLFHHGTGKVGHDLACNTTAPGELERLLAAAAEARTASGRPAPEPLGL